MAAIRRAGTRTINATARHIRTYATSAPPRVHAHTLYSPTSALLEEYLSTLPQSSSTVYILSTSLSQSTISSLLPALQSLPSSIGSFGISHHEPTLSIASFPSARIWRTELSGRRPKQVGRAQRLGTKPDEGDSKGSEIGDSEDVRREEGWAGLWREGVSNERIRELEGVDAKSFLLLTDGNPRPVLSGLEAMFPRSNKIGMLSAATPFLTGRPHTLLYSKEVFESGTVGLALEGDLITKVEFGVRPLTEVFTIAGAQGNLLLRLSEGNGNPTQTLMNAIQRRDAGAFTNKDEEFFLSLNSGERVVKILSGDPSRGALSLDMEEPLLEGDKVQFVCRDNNSLPRPVTGHLTFSALQRSDDLHGEVSAGTPRIVNGFLGLSEDGFVDNTAICTVPLATASWRL